VIHIKNDEKADQNRIVKHIPFYRI